MINFAFKKTKVQKKKKKMILAQYTIRSKQDYIFKTNRVLEIIGASKNIAGIWDELFRVADTISIKYQRADEKFCFERIKKDFADDKLHMVELFCGGGNETLIFSSEKIYHQLNKAFSYMILKKYPGMIPMSVHAKAEGNYSYDYNKLMAASDIKKNVMEPQWDMFTVPFAMIDRATLQPYSTVRKINGIEVRMSDESYSKYEGARKIRDKKEVRVFDEMITDKGKESLLAVVHCDGNNMGVKIRAMLNNEHNYDHAVEQMRLFTKTTADCFEIKGGEALYKCFRNLDKNNKKLSDDKKLKESSYAYRRIISSADDVTFICNARFVMDYVKAYLDSVQNYASNKKKNEKKEGKGNRYDTWTYSACAGICIFHSHYPFSRAYSIAEQACDEAKKKVHVTADSGTSPIEQGWMDFHFIHSGISGDLEELRRYQEIDHLIARPWIISGEYGNITFSYANWLKLNNIIEKNKVSRSTLKTITSAYERSKSAAQTELIHVFGHNKGFEKDLENIFENEDERLQALYDISEIYDLWYRGVK